MPLRVGLVAAMLLLVGCGLLATGDRGRRFCGTASSTARIRRCSTRLGGGLRSRGARPLPAEDEVPNPARPPSNFYVRGIDDDGRVWMAVNDRDAQRRCRMTTMSVRFR